MNILETNTNRLITNHESLISESWDPCVGEAGERRATRDSGIHV
jgi:hypothetical protein